MTRNERFEDEADRAVINPQGLHARPADLIVKAATRFQSNVEIVKGHEQRGRQKLLAIFTLAALPGTELVIEAEGPDAADAVSALCELFEAVLTS